MSRSRTSLYLGAALVGGAGYYLYSSGGKPKAAERKFESDLRKARDRVTATGDQVQNEAERYGAKAGAKVDSAWNKTNSEISRAKANARDASADAAQKAEAYAKDAQAKANKAIDTFDKKVEEASAKTKSSVSGWFGGK